MRNRSYRRFQRERTIARHIRDYQSILGGNVETLGYISDTRHPLDCGKPQCRMCRDGINRPTRATDNRSAITEQTVNA